jgi:hypothetical protein
MTVLGISEAKYFCRGTGAITTIPNSSFRNWAASTHLNQAFLEPSPGYDMLRASSRREVSRLLFLGASHYRRSFDLLLPSSAGWAQVTLYYGSFFIAHALLGMFGAPRMGKYVLEVTNGAPGAQRFQVSKSPVATGGSHQSFWSHFYHSMISLQPLVNAPVRFALDPISKDPHWLINNRNGVNYDSYLAVDLAAQHQARFRKSSPRTTLPGALGIQLHHLEAMLTIASTFARDFRLKTDVLASLSPNGSRNAKMRSLVLGPPLGSMAHHVRRRCIW